MELFDIEYREQSLGADETVFIGRHGVDTDRIILFTAVIIALCQRKDPIAAFFWYHRHDRTMASTVISGHTSFGALGTQLAIDHTLALAVYFPDFVPFSRSSGIMDHSPAIIPCPHTCLYPFLHLLPTTIPFFLMS